MTLTSKAFRSRIIFSADEWPALGASEVDCREKLVNFGRENASRLSENFSPGEEWNRAQSIKGPLLRPCAALRSRPYLPVPQPAVRRSNALVTPQEPTDLDSLTAYAEGYAEFAMKNSGQVPTTMLAVTPQGLLHFLPESLADETAKNNFAEIGRLICAAYGATCIVMILESWVTMAKPDEALDMDTPPSEAFDREEFVVVMGETFGRKTQRFLPILRTDAGGFFGFGEFDASKFNGIEGRFAGMLPPKKATRETREMTKAVLTAMGVTLKSLRAP